MYRTLVPSRQAGRSSIAAAGEESSGYYAHNSSVCLLSTKAHAVLNPLSQVV
jgi:hypothetical protein